MIQYTRMTKALIQSSKTSPNPYAIDTKPNIKVIVFDYHGVIMPNKKSGSVILQAITILKAAEHTKQDIEELAHKFFRVYPKLKSTTKTLMHILDIPQDLARKINIDGHKQFIKYRKELPTRQLIKFLQKLGKKYDIYLLTRGVNEILAKDIYFQKIRPYFNQVIVTQKQPKLYYLKLLLQKYKKLKPQNFLVIGDKVHSDIDPALELNMHAILFGKKPILPKGKLYQNVKTVSSFKDLERILL